MIIVLAGNFQQYRDYCRDNKIIEANKTHRYAQDINSIRGFNIDDYVVYGTFWDRNDSNKLWEAVMVRFRMHNKVQPLSWTDRIKNCLRWISRWLSKKKP